jgi:hypothetical protein
VSQVLEFLTSDSEVQAKVDDVLSRYDSLRAVANRIRNQAAFHYPYESGQQAMARALRELVDHEGAIRGTKLGDSRQVFADDVINQLLVNACGGTREAYERACTDFADAIASFGRFAHVAIEAYLLRHRAALRKQPNN